MTTLNLHPPAPFDFTDPDEMASLEMQVSIVPISLWSRFGKQRTTSQYTPLLYGKSSRRYPLLNRNGKKKSKTVMEKFDTLEEMSFLNELVLIVAAKDRTNLLNSTSLVYIN